MEQPMGTAVDSVLYYYGSISRETAEWVLWDRGCRDGMYLLRESNSDYVLSLCFQKSVLHYRIKKLSSGEVGLCGVPRQRFPGPVELVQGVEGLACRPTTPCNKSPDSVLPLTHWGVTEDTIRKAVLKKAKEWGIDEDKLDANLTESFSDIKLLITKTLHEVQPWFHGLLSRVEAERSIEESGHKDGKFLVRERDDSSYALCLSHSGRIKHYKIDVLPSGEFAIQDGQRFPSIMALVSHYTLFSDGLWCSLQDPCVVPPRRSSDASRSRSSEGEARSNHSSPPSKTSRFLNSLNQRRLFSKLFSTVQFSSQTLPPQGHPSTSKRLYPSLSDDNLDPTTPVVAVATPPRSRKPHDRIHKASSFDFLPAFLSLFIYGEGGTDSAARHMKSAKDCVKKQPHRTMPVPAPRLSLANRVSNGPVYANREALGGRSVSLGEDQSMEESVANGGLVRQNGLPIPQPFIRSASSPSVVSHSKTRTQQLSSVRLSSSEGGEPAVILEPSLRPSSLNGQTDIVPVPKPRKKLPAQDRTETSCDSCASVDSSTSPTLTEISEYGQESFSEDIFQSDIVPEDTPKDNVPPPKPALALGEDLLLLEGFPSPPKGNTENSVYATLSGSSDVICLLSHDVPPPPPPPSSNVVCPEGILVDLGSCNDLSTLSREESDLAYLTLRECQRGPLNLDQKAIDLKEKIGTGIFCDVFRGVFSNGPVEVQFAIKMLKSSSVPNPKSEILKEAQTMIALDHPHIVRLIGVSDTTSFMLVMELAPLGPLSKYLRLHKEISISEVLLLLLQVVSAMEYLESKQFVHRDLAARNVLLVNESFVKISDFGMSRALGLGKEYYRAETAGKWPLKWYAPECIYYFKFSSKSDVWSYGVTLWEAMSYGEKPYQGMVGSDILRMFERNERLAKPESCPDSVYSIMRKCWQYKAEDRPSFTEISEMLRNCVGTNI